MVYHQGAFADVDAFWSGDERVDVSDPSGSLTVRPVLSWWVRVSTEGIASGWVRIVDNSNLSGPNLYCPRF